MNEIKNKRPAIGDPDREFYETQVQLDEACADDRDECALAMYGLVANIVWPIVDVDLVDDPLEAGSHAIECVNVHDDNDPVWGAVKYLLSVPEFDPQKLGSELLICEQQRGPYFGPTFWQPPAWQGGDC